MNAPILQVDISWRMNGKSARAQFDLQSGVTALVGPSGAGKTTLARILCGLEEGASGSILLDDKALFHRGKSVNEPAHRRAIGLVMQENALFPTMTVSDNIALGSVMTDAELLPIIEVTGITKLMHRMPETLSGGEARRVSIARAVAAKPRLLILDEPMSGLDPKRRKKIMTLIRQIAGVTGTPILMITHQIEEMLHVADHALLMQDGQIVFRGSIEDVLSARETTDALGVNDAGCVLTATVTGREHGLLKTDTGGDTLYIADDKEPNGAKLRLRILAQDVALSLEPLRGVSIVNQLPGTITSIEMRASDDLVTIALAGSGSALRSKITKRSTALLALKAGTQVHCLVKAVAVKEMLAEQPTDSAR